MLANFQNPNEFSKQVVKEYNFSATGQGAGYSFLVARHQTSQSSIAAWIHVHFGGKVTFHTQFRD